MSKKYSQLPIEQIIKNHLHDIDYMTLNIQNSVLQRIISKPSSFRLKDTRFDSKTTIKKKYTIQNNNNPNSPQVKKVQSLQNTINLFDSRIREIQPNEQSKHKIKINFRQNNTDRLPSSGLKKDISRSSSVRKSLTRFLFQFEVPNNKQHLSKGKKSFVVPIDKIHTLDQNKQFRRKIQSQYIFRSTCMTQTLSVQSKPLRVESRKVLTTPSQVQEIRRPTSCRFRKVPKQITQPDCAWELKPWNNNEQLIF